MKDKKKYTVVLLTLLVLVMAVFFVKPDEAFLFQNAKGDCSGRSIFMYNALYKDTLNANIVFFGSSRTMNDVNDSLMNASANKRFLNLGYCRFGRNLDYFFIEEYCRLHHPDKIVLEVREEEGSASHPLTAFLLPVSGIAEGALYLDPSLFKNLYNKWLCNLKFARGQILGKKPGEPGLVNTGHGFWYGNKVTDTGPLIQKRNKDSLDLQKAGLHHQNLQLNTEYYFKKLKALCDDKNIELSFLFLPSYGNLGGVPLQLSDYNAYGKTLIPPDSILKNVLNFSDYGHLNKRGADQLSNWMQKQFK
ncbi:MAG: hypothetical protein V4635_04970 [Bacteroidota bacterium]